MGTNKGQNSFSLIIDAGQTVFTVLFVSRVARPKKVCQPGERELPSAVVAPQACTAATFPVMITASIFSEAIDSTFTSFYSV